VAAVHAEAVLGDLVARLGGEQFAVPGAILSGGLCGRLELEHRCGDLAGGHVGDRGRGPFEYE
jgi:hypothetical protein